MRRPAALAAGLALLTGCAGDRPDEPERPPFLPAPAAAEPESAGRWMTARLTERTVLRAAPGGRALARLGMRTEFGSRRVLSVARRRDGWLAVITPERPNGRLGWIPEGRARVSGTDWSLHVDRSARRLTVRRDGRAVSRFAVAVGRPGTPTPTGRFAVTDKLHPRPGSPYGCCAIALSGHQTQRLPGWPGGDRLAIHATPQEETVGTRASLGCLRAREGDIRRLMRILPVGAPVFVSA